MRISFVPRALGERPDSEHDRRCSAVLLARAYAELGRRDEARTLFREALDGYARAGAPGAVAACDARVRYAEFLATPWWRWRLAIATQRAATPSGRSRPVSVWTACRRRRAAPRGR